MARQHLSVCAALYLFAFALPLVAARLGGRSCHTSFFFPDLTVNNNNDLRPITLLREADANENGFKIFSVAAAKLHDSEHYRPPSNFIQVRLLNLHRQSLFNPRLSHAHDLPHALDFPRAWREAPIMDKVSVEQPTHNELVRTWTFSTSNPHRPITWIDVHSRRGTWRHDFADHIEPKPLHFDNDEWHSTVNELWRIAFGLLLGAVTGMVFAAITAMVWSLLRRMCMRPQDDDDVGFLYGYQELPSPRSLEKEVKDSQKEFTKDTAGKVENM